MLDLTDILRIMVQFAIKNVDQCNVQINLRGLTVSSDLHCPHTTALIYTDRPVIT